MRVLVTGGAGFIGSWLVEALVAAGHRVCVLDDLSSGRLENLGGVQRSEAVETVIGDVADTPRLRELLRDCDAVAHLAASVGVGSIHRAASASIRNNVLGTESVIEAVAEAGVHLLYASSSEVYGKDLTPPYREDADLHLGPTRVHRWSYAASKALGEWSALARQRESGFPLTIVRFFNTVGPRQRSDQGMVLPTFFAAAAAGLPLKVHGGGRQTRCFAHVEDVAKVLCQLIDSPAGKPRILNVGSSEEVAIRDLAERVVCALGSSSEIEDLDPRVLYGPDFEDTPRRVPDLTALQREIPEARMRPLDAIIREMTAATRFVAE